MTARIDIDRKPGRPAPAMDTTSPAKFASAQGQAPSETAASSIAAGVHSAGSAFTAAQAAPASHSALNGFARPKAPARSSVTTGSSRHASTERKKEAGAEQKLRSGTLEVRDFQGLGDAKAAELISQMAAGSPKQRKNLEALLDDPAFARHLGAALGQMDAATSAKLFDTVYKKGAPTEQVQATLHAALDTMDPSRRGEMLGSVLRGADPEAKAAAGSYLNHLRKSGEMKSADFKHLPAATVAELVKEMAASPSSEQQSNLKKLLTDNQFSGPLKQALTELGSEERHRVLQMAGGAMSSPDAAKVRSTLGEALNSIDPAIRNEMLQKALLGDGFANVAANAYLSRSAGKGAMTSLTQSLGSDPATFGAVLGKLSPDAMESLLFQMSDGSPEVVQKFFRNVGDAVYASGNSDELRNAITDAMQRNPGSSLEMLKQVANDPLGNGTHERQINNGQRLVAEIFDVMGAEKTMDFLGQAKFAGTVKEFLRNHSRNEEVQKALDSSSKKEEAESLAKLVVEGYSTHGSFLKPVGRKEMLSALEKDPNRVLRELSDSQVKEVVKFFLQAGEMDKLTGVAKQLSPQMAAKLVRAIPAAAEESRAEIAAGDWMGDLVKGLKVSLKAGEAKSGGEGGVEFSPKDMVDGGRKRETNAVDAAFNRFKADFEAYLNGLSPNQKQIFIDETQDFVKL